MYKNSIKRISFLCCLSNIIVIEINFYYYTTELQYTSIKMSTKWPRINNNNIQLLFLLLLLLLCAPAPADII